MPLPVFSILRNSSPGPTRTQLEIRKDREISTRDINVEHQYAENSTFIRSCVNRYSWWNKSCDSRFTQLSIEA